MRNPIYNQLRIHMRHCLNRSLGNDKYLLTFFALCNFQQFLCQCDTQLVWV
jgi:hypothetical protein